MKKGWQVRSLYPWERNLTGLPQLLSGHRLLVIGGSLTRRPQRLLRCLLDRASWQI